MKHKARTCGTGTGPDHGWLAEPDRGATVSSTDLPPITLRSKLMAVFFENPLRKSAIWRRCRDAARVQLAELQGTGVNNPVIDAQDNELIRWFCMGCGAQLTHHPLHFGHCFRCNPDAAR